ncbi:hypothetical protein [Reichenbachiella sp.]|uniref:hypothetical protein n=1 Tax=Reichenbachiella sp. TaxID=2184521 RepID=UPI003B5983DB
MKKLFYLIIVIGLSHMTWAQSGIEKHSQWLAMSASEREQNINLVQEAIDEVKNDANISDLKKGEIYTDLAVYTYQNKSQEEGLAIAKKATDLGYARFYSIMAGQASSTEERKNWFEKGLPLAQADPFYHYIYAQFLLNEADDARGSLAQMQQGFDQLTKRFTIDWENLTISNTPFESSFEEMTQQNVKVATLAFLIQMLDAVNEGNKYDQILERLVAHCFESRMDEAQLYKVCITTFLKVSTMDKLERHVNRYLGRMAAQNRSDEALVRRTLLWYYFDQSQYNMLEDLAREAINANADLPEGVLTYRDMKYHAEYYWFAGVALYAAERPESEYLEKFKTAYQLAKEYGNSDCVDLVKQVVPDIESRI